MSRYKLLDGYHAQDEVVVDENGDAVLNDDGTTKSVQVMYGKGDVFHSDKDLVALFNQPGCVKFEKIGDGSSSRGNAAAALEEANTTQPLNPSVAPGGQVSTGFQQSTSLPDGTTVSGPLKGKEEDRTTRVASLVGEGSTPKVFGKVGIAKGTASTLTKPARGDTTEPAYDEEWSEESLEALTIPELKDKAAQYNIDLADAHLKADIVKAVHKGRPKK